ncbi:PR domain zinc finger protein 5-like [Plutella xylostella]|uniref:PR domain zinc finger protein 5-like n=1 Tax=Plutella xylostella TaxID=51655 RepID=UPI002032AF48|nr:PR domain zinc finger protein 5-like [Plutella xylostella]
MDYATICRCCMSQQSTKQLNFTYKNSDGEFENFSDDLLECFNIWVTETELPSHICNSCIQKLQDALDFRKMVIKSDEEFLRLIEQGVVPCTVPSRVTDNYDDDDDMNDETESIHVEAKQNDDEKNVPNILLTTVKVKQEVVQETADDDNEMNDTRDYSTNYGSVNVLENKNTIEVPVKFESPPAGPAVAPPMGPSLHFLFMSTTVKPFRWSYGVFQCFYCKASSTDYIRIRTHVDTHKCSTEDITTLTNSGLPIKLDITNITCNVCRKPYETLAELIKHLNGKHSLGFDYDGVTLEEYKVVHLKCHLCVNSFGDFNSLHAHVLQTHKFTCPECQRVFYNKQFLFNHMTQFHKVVFCTTSFKCKLCKIKFQTKDLLDAHFESLHLTPSLTGYKVLPTNDQGYMQCPVCHNKFSSEKNLQIHIDKFHVQCKSCSRLFDCSTTLERHLAEAHGDDGATESEDAGSDEMEFAEPDSSKSNRNSSKTGSRSLRRRLKANVATLLNMSSALPFTFRYTKFLCFYCKDPFPDPESLASHTTENHPVWDADIVNLSAANFRLKLNVYNLRCKVCEEQPADIDKLLAHLTSLHGVSFDPGLRPCLVPFRLAPGKMECVHCPGLEFQYFNLLHQHFNSMHGQENEVCDHCGKCFDTIGLLNGHILTYHTEGKYVCKICSEDCVNWHKLRNHLAMVHGEETEACKICGEKFQTLYLKQKHMMTAHNSGHKCPHCDRVFHLRSFMNNHIRRTHLKEKNVPCHVCGKRFFNKLTLSGHMVTHDASLQRLYHCEHCEKGFTKKKYLRLHISRHHAQ